MSTRKTARTKDCRMSKGAASFLAWKREQVVPEGMVVDRTEVLYEDWSSCCLCGKRRGPGRERAMGFYVRKPTGGRELKRAVCEVCYKERRED